MAAEPPSEPPPQPDPGDVSEPVLELHMDQIAHQAALAALRRRLPDSLKRFLA